VDQARPDAGVGLARDTGGARWRRSVGPTAALGAVLLALAAYVILATLNSASIARHQAQVLAIDALFAEARTSIALEEVHLRHYQVEPSVAVRVRFGRSADAATAALAKVRDTGPQQAREHAQRLHDEQIEYRRLAVLLMAKVTDQDPEQGPYDRLYVTPAHYVLQQDVDDVSRTYHREAQLQAENLRRAHVRMLIGTSVGFGVGLALVAMIWRMMLGYQRRLIQQADSSEHQALHDPLTGLPNRVLFAQRLNAAVSAGERTRVALMAIDLNGFKAVNDTLGHAAGDQLLMETGRRLSLAARRGDVVARLGGDEFAILLPDMPDAETAVQIGHRLAEALREDFLLDDGPAAVSGSVGIALSPAPGGEAELMRHADAAMYRAKAAGGGVVLYDAAVDAELPDRMTLYADLRALLDAGDPDGQLRLYYQPQVSLRDGSVTGVEALVRWQHPGRGLLPPKDFLTIAETRGLEVLLTYHLLDVAVRQAARWRAEGQPLAVAVNVSPRCLLDGDFVAQVRRTVGRHHLPPHLLRLEVTETSIMTDPERAIAALRDVHEFGVSVSIDDFGTGFSSLAQLKRLPAHELKIDQTFVRALRPGSEDELVVRSAIDLAHNLGLSVVAEGVEDVATLVALRGLACDYAQGFVLSRPVPVDQVMAACDRSRQLAQAAIADALDETPLVDR
jgi:diguanylate cyclase (GGDEF)-like protein